MTAEEGSTISGPTPTVGPYTSIQLWQCLRHQRLILCRVLGGEQVIEMNHPASRLPHLLLFSLHLEHLSQLSSLAKSYLSFKIYHRTFTS